jgi:hypothetical protein
MNSTRYFLQMRKMVADVTTELLTPRASTVLLTFRVGMVGVVHFSWLHTHHP